MCIVVTTNGFALNQAKILQIYSFCVERQQKEKIKKKKKKKKKKNEFLKNVERRTDKGSSSHWGLIILSDQEANRDNLGITKTRLFKYKENFTSKNIFQIKLWYFFIFLHKK